MTKAEYDALDLYYQSRKEYERKRVLQIIMKKFAGILFIGISVADALLLEDLTVGSIFVPLGLYLVFTRRKGW